jgi:hypothetical protein
LCGGNKKNPENLSQDSQFPRQDLNPEPPEYEVGVLITQIQHSIPLLCKNTKNQDKKPIILPFYML